jgi:hypothetical protein
MNGMNHRFHVARRNIGTVQLSFLFEFHYHMSLLTSPFDDVRLDGPQVTWNGQRMSLRHLQSLAQQCSFGALREARFHGLEIDCKLGSSHDDWVGLPSLGSKNLFSTKIHFRNQQTN